jgi:hypothetical protein
VDEGSRFTGTERIWIDPEGILRFVTLPVAQELEDAVENVRVSRELGSGVPRPGLLDSREAISISREARSYYAGPENARVLSAVAILVGSPLSRVIGNFFIGLNRTSFPSRLFTSEEQALAWLRSFLS